LQIAAPMPTLAPVTRATRFFHRIIPARAMLFNNSGLIPYYRDTESVR
jgi:hypothetical protein